MDKIAKKMEINIKLQELKSREDAIEQEIGQMDARRESLDPNDEKHLEKLEGDLEEIRQMRRALESVKA